MGRKKRAVKTANDEKTSEKIEKTDQISEVAEQFNLPSVTIKDLKKIQIPEKEITEDHQSTLPNKDLFRIDEVATYFSVTERTVRLWIDHGHLIAVKKVGTIRVLRKSILDCHILDKREVI